ncbi:NAD-dependent epimerase/dehydratase family protein [Arthrobacter sp. BHU FT2]|nr:NAD-dependent epimerase/dehydratase family protein [Arthrobacter sp. BHU FT2]
MKVLVTGASGYIGGSVANALLASGHDVVGLVRSEESAGSLRAAGIEPVVGVLDDSGLLTRLAKDADAVVNAAVVDHRGAADALVAALRGSGKPFIQTSGSGVIADGARGELSHDVFTDQDETVVKLPQRQGRADLCRFVLAAADDGVVSSVIHPTMVYGRGTGQNPNSTQIPMMIRAAKKRQAGMVVGKGENRWSNVHIEDLAELYALVLAKGEAGTSYYAENGENSMLDIAGAIGRLLGYDTVGSFTIPEAENEYGEFMTLSSLGSNSRVRATNADKLGWKPGRRALIDDIEHGSYYQDEQRA